MPPLMVQLEVPIFKKKKFLSSLMWYQKQINPQATIFMSATILDYEKSRDYTKDQILNKDSKRSDYIERSMEIKEIVRYMIAVKKTTVKAI